MNNIEYNVYLNSKAMGIIQHSVQYTTCSIQTFAFCAQYTYYIYCNKSDMLAWSVSTVYTVITYKHTDKDTCLRMRVYTDMHARWASILRLSLMTKNPQSGQHGWI